MQLQHANNYEQLKLISTLSMKLGLKLELSNSTAGLHETVHPRL